MEFSFEVKRAFFDKEDVIKRIESARLQMLLKAGAFVRRRGQRLLRRGKRSSRPDSPPKVHSKNDRVSLRNILFFSDGKDGILIGPVGLNGSKRKGRRPVPGALEKGDVLRVREVRNRKEMAKNPRSKKAKVWKIVDRSPTKDEESRARDVDLFKRPFMGPALKLEAPKFPDLFGEEWSK